MKQNVNTDGNSRQQRKSSRPGVTRKGNAYGTWICNVLAVVSVAVLFCCVNYLQLKAELTGRIKSVASLESEWAHSFKEENDAYESQVTSEVDLNQIKEIAIGTSGNELSH